MKLIYQFDKGFDYNSLLGKFDLPLRNIIKSQLNSTDAWVNDNWVKLDDDLSSILSRKYDRVIVYSGIDWERSRQKPEIFELLNKHNTIYIGNSYGEYYFSWWMEFVYANLNKFLSFNTYNIRENLKPYMCLNRKPHWHRIKLVKSLKDSGLLEKGYVSLGKDPGVDEYYGLNVPILLKEDVMNEEGDSTTWGDVGGITNDITSLGSEYYWNSHFLNVVTETSTFSDVFLSEKIFKPIIGRRPFILLGDVRAYEVLHEWGIDTFDDLFGDGYKEKDIFKRIQWITDTVGVYSDDKNLYSLLNTLRPRLDNNYKAFIQAAKVNRDKIHNLF
jgi:hypothetical protein